MASSKRTHYGMDGVVYDLEDIRKWHPQAINYIDIAERHGYGFDDGSHHFMDHDKKGSFIVNDDGSWELFKNKQSYKGSSPEELDKYLSSIH